jgi:CheY-like chemotaxis protein
MSRTLLLVEDNELFRGMLRSLLTMRGYNVVTASNGTEGMAVAAEYEIDAALADVEMPGMDGFEFCARLREALKSTGQDLPVFIMTGVFRPALEKRAAAAGAVLVLRKPFPIEEVCAKLEREFERRSDSPLPGGAAPEATGDGAST